MVAKQRRLKILDLIRQDGFASLDALARQLGVSESTVRRDVTALDQDGKIRRTHGGVLPISSLPDNPHFRQHQTSAQPQKRAIALVAAEMVGERETVLLDGGSTTYELGLRLMGRNLQIVTNSLPLANLFSRSESTDLTLVGGHLHSRTGVLLGPVAKRTLDQLHCRWAFLSVAGLDEERLYNDNQLLVETERSMMGAADRVVILADSSKFGRKGMFPLCEWDRVHSVVVDHHLAAQWRDQISKSTELIIAEPEVETILTGNGNE
jgi:DeoR family transcriptional regulator, fructose operon transcriptional repressor